MTEICKKCAECCKNHPVVDLSANEISLLVEETGLRMDLFTNRKGKAVEEYFLQFQNNGSCIFLQEKNGGFACGVYHARPGICKKYPSRPIQESFCLKNCEKFMGPMAGKKTS